MHLTQISELVAPEIEGLEKELHRILGADHPFLEELIQRIMATPGKRLRPKLLLLCTKMLGYEGPLAILYACVFELVHTASLIHDDIIDEAQTRRGRITMNQDVGNTITVLFGDLIYTKAYIAAIEGGRMDVFRVLTQATERMIQGELLQDKYNFDLDITEEAYLDILKRKTAYLFGGAAQTAGLIADSPAPICRDLYEFGFNLGVSFQLMDDYLDYVGSATQMGKPVLSDLREGKVTLPIIRLLQREPGVSRMVEQFWKEGEQALPGALLELIQADAGLEETKQMARDYSERAVKNLEAVPNNPYSHTLRELPLQLLYRKH